jgi:hypothetical protein
MHAVVIAAFYKVRNVSVPDKQGLQLLVADAGNLKGIGS